MLRSGMFAGEAQEFAHTRAPQMKEAEVKSLLNSTKWIRSMRMGPQKVHLWTGRHDIGYHYRLEVLWAKGRNAVEIFSSPEAEHSAKDVQPTLLDTAPEPNALQFSPNALQFSPIRISDSPLSHSSQTEPATCAGMKRPAELSPVDPESMGAEEKRTKLWEHMRRHNRVEITRSP